MRCPRELLKLPTYSWGSRRPHAGYVLAQEEDSKLSPVADLEEVKAEAELSAAQLSTEGAPNTHTDPLGKDLDTYGFRALKENSA